jgi:hypothetical protein
MAGGAARSTRFQRGFIADCAMQINAELKTIPGSKE